MRPSGRTEAAVGPRWIGVLLLGGILLALRVPSARALDGLQVGMKAPAFTLKALDGREMALGDVREARAIVVVFWATWSRSAPEVLERLERLHRKYGGRDLAVIGVSVENQQMSPQDVAALRAMAGRLGLTFPLLLDERLRTFREYGVVAVPSTVLLDKELVIRGELAAYPLATREELFELIEAMAEWRQITRPAKKAAYEPVPRAIRYYNLARAMAGRGMVDAVDENLRKAIGADPRFLLPKVMLARTLRERAETEEAIEYGGRTHVTATYREERDKHLQAAEALLAEALALEPTNSPALTELATIQLLRGERGKAEQRVAQALRAEPSHTPALVLRGRLLLARGRTAEAATAFEAAVRLNPLDFRVYYAMARSYEERGMVKEAIAAYKKAYEALRTAGDLFPFSFGR